MEFVLSLGYSRFFTEWDDAFSNALCNAEDNLELYCSEIIDWLEQNLEGKYHISDEYDQNACDVYCELTLVIPDESDAMAFMITWSEELDKIVDI